MQNGGFGIMLLGLGLWLWTCVILVARRQSRQRLPRLLERTEMDHCHNYGPNTCTDGHTRRYGWQARQQVAQSGLSAWFADEENWQSQPGRWF
jgi:hypothetical protein